MDAAIVVAVVSGVFSVIGIVLQQLDRRRQARDQRAKEREKDRQDRIDARPDEAVRRLTSALDRADKQAAYYAKQLDKAEHDNAELRAKFQESLDTRDRLIGEARDLRRQLEEAPIECNKLKGKQ